MSLSLSLSVHLLLYLPPAAVSSDITEMEDIIEINNSPSHLLSIHSKHFSHQHCHVYGSSVSAFDRVIILCWAEQQQRFRCVRSSVHLNSPRLFSMPCLPVGLHAAWPIFGLVQTRIPLTSEKTEREKGIGLILFTVSAQLMRLKTDFILRLITN